MLSNIIIINNLKITSGFPSDYTWHINCYQRFLSDAGMSIQERRVLVIDPDSKVRRQFAHYLRRHDYYVETGKNLSEALKKISQGSFSCLIIDVDLPEMKGYEAVSIIKNLDPGLKIIMTSQKNNKRLEAKVREQDIFFYFIKSFGKEELKLAIQNAFNH